MNIINGIRNKSLFEDHYKGHSWKNNNTYKNINCNSLLTIQNVFVEQVQNKINELAFNQFVSSDKISNQCGIFYHFFT